MRRAAPNIATGLVLLTLLMGCQDSNPADAKATVAAARIDSSSTVVSTATNSPTTAPPTTAPPPTSSKVDCPPNTTITLAPFAIGHVPPITIVEFDAVKPCFVAVRTDEAIVLGSIYAGAEGTSASVALAADGLDLWVAQRGDSNDPAESCMGSILRIPLATGIAELVTHGGELALSADGTKLAYSADARERNRAPDPDHQPWDCGRNIIVIRDISTGFEVEPLDAPIETFNDLLALAWSPDGRYLAYDAWGADIVHSSVIDVQARASGAIRESQELFAHVAPQLGNSIALSGWRHDGSVVASVSAYPDVFFTHQPDHNSVASGAVRHGGDCPGDAIVCVELTDNLTLSHPDLTGLRAATAGYSLRRTDRGYVIGGGGRNIEGAGLRVYWPASVMFLDYG
jgi:hypothetical protein